MNGADLIVGILKQEGIEYIPALGHCDMIDAAAQAEQQVAANINIVRKLPAGL
jgi:hypothetical protein